MCVHSDRPFHGLLFRRDPEMIQHITARPQKLINRYRSLDYAIYHGTTSNGTFDAVQQIPARRDMKRHPVTIVDQVPPDSAEI